MASAAHCRSSWVFGAHLDAGPGMVDRVAGAAAVGHQAHCLSSWVGAFGAEVARLRIPSSRQSLDDSEETAAAHGRREREDVVVVGGAPV